MRFLTTWLFIIIVIAFFGVGKAFYHEDNTQDIYNITNGGLFEWNSSIWDEKGNEMFYNQTNLNVSGITIMHFRKIIYKGIDAFGYIGFEVAKWGVEAGFRHPEWNYLWVAKWLTIVIIISIALPLIAVLPALIALLYLTGVGIVKAFKWIVKKVKHKHSTQPTTNKQE